MKPFLLAGEEVSWGIFSVTSTKHVTVSTWIPNFCTVVGPCLLVGRRPRRGRLIHFRHHHKQPLRPHSPCRWDWGVGLQLIPSFSSPHNDTASNEERNRAWYVIQFVINIFSNRISQKRSIQDTNNIINIKNVHCKC